MDRRMLVLKACGSSDEPQECKSIREQAAMYGIKCVCKNILDNGSISNTLSSNGSFDYIYLSAHGCAEGFGSENGRVDMNWEEFSQKLCENQVMNEDCILMLSCCRGGLMQVAYKLFNGCEQISYVLGPRQSLASADMHICFGIFLYNMEVRYTDPIVACEKIKLATDQRFSCYDRQEEEIYFENWLSNNISNAIDEAANDEDSSSNAAAAPHEPTKQVVNHTKGLKVTFPDGTVVAERTANDTLIRVLQKIGLAKVASSGLTHGGGYGLVSKTMRPIEAGRTWQHKVGGYYVYVNISNQQKKDDLTKLSEMFGLGLKIEDGK